MKMRSLKHQVDKGNTVQRGMLQWPEIHFPLNADPAHPRTTLATAKTALQKVGL